MNARGLSRASGDVPVETLRQLLRLDSETGRLFWREREARWFNDGAYSAAHARAIWNSRYAEKEAFTTNNGKGYLLGRIFQHHHYAHRVVFALH